MRRYFDTSTRLRWRDSVFFDSQYSQYSSTPVCGNNSSEGRSIDLPVYAFYIQVDIKYLVACILAVPIRRKAG